jgi:hypothetical protein
MTEDFNPAPISIEDKKEILDIIDNTSLNRMFKLPTTIFK